MSRAANKAGVKVGRRERHVARAKATRERKRLRRLRGEICAAIQEAEATRRRRKKGKGERDKIMRELGWRPTGRDGTIDERYERVT